ncbi:MAG: hypothetical protein V4611_03445 [Patescibacteria group bacterium]
MIPEQQNSDQLETPPEAHIETKKTAPSRRRKVVLIIISSVVLFLLAAGTTYTVMALQNKDVSTETSQVATTDEDEIKPTVDNIYVYSDANLVAINPETKEFAIVDTAIDGESGNANLGSTVPLTAPDFQAAVYTKDNTGWIVTGTEKKIFYSIPETAKATGFYSLYLSAWSTDSTKIAFSIGFMCPIYGPCTEASEDKSVSGVYVYDLITEKASKVQSTGVIQWLPQSTKLAYFDDATTPQKLLLNDTTAGTTSTAATKNFGFAPQASISDDAKKIIYSAGVDGTESAATFIQNIDGSDQKTLKTSNFADLQWPKFLPESNADYAYSKRKEIQCYNGTSGCVSASLQIVKGGEDKKAVEDIDSRVIGFYKNQAVVVMSDGQVGLDPNNPAPYKATVSLVDLTSFKASKIYEKTTQKGGEVDMQIKLRIRE